MTALPRLLVLPRPLVSASSFRSSSFSRFALSASSLAVWTSRLVISSSLLRALICFRASSSDSLWSALLLKTSAVAVPTAAACFSSLTYRPFRFLLLEATFHTSTILSLARWATSSVGACSSSSSLSYTDALWFERTWLAERLLMLLSTSSSIASLLSLFSLSMASPRPTYNPVVCGLPRFPLVSSDDEGSSPPSSILLFRGGFSFSILLEPSSDSSESTYLGDWVSSPCSLSPNAAKRLAARVASLRLLLSAFRATLALFVCVAPGADPLLVQTPRFALEQVGPSLPFLPWPSCQRWS